MPRASASGRRALSRGVGGAHPGGAGLLLRDRQQVVARDAVRMAGKALDLLDAQKLPAEHGKQTLEELFITVAREPLTLELD